MKSNQTTISDQYQQEIDALKARQRQLEEEVRHYQRHQHATRVFLDHLKILTQISVELDRIASLDVFLRQVIELGRIHLGIDRLSMWLLDESREYMVGTFGVTEHGDIRDERDKRWRFKGDVVMAFYNGELNAVVNEDAELLNDRSEFVGRGWHVAVPLLNGDEFVGFMASDNLVTRKPLQPYQAELMQIYGALIGYLIRSKQDRLRSEQQHIQFQLERERIKLLETFITNVAHEFKNPLSIINTKTFLLKHNNHDTHQLTKLQSINEQAELMNTMLDQMLLMVRLHGDLKLVTQPMQINHLLKSCVKRFQITSVGEERHWQLDLQDLPTYQIHFEWFEQSMMELIDNAIKYSAVDDTITIETSQSEDDIIIRISDTGIGMSSEQAQFIFDSLYRVDGARTQRGTGLGLTIVRKVIELHQGTIDVDSTLDVGSTFIIRLPIRG